MTPAGRRAPLEARQHVAKLVSGDVEQSCAGPDSVESVPTSNDMNARYVVKNELFRGLYRCGLNREEILDFFHFVDWVLALPPPLEYAFREEVAKYEEQLEMPYITSVERIGRIEALRGSILRFARARWGAEVESWAAKLEAISDYDQLNAVLDRVAVADKPEKVTF